MWILSNLIEHCIDLIRNLDVIDNLGCNFYSSFRGTIKSKACKIFYHNSVQIDKKHKYN